MKPQILALYLPQFYPFSENDEWWGKGFTEWTNVGKARALFKGHYQPRVPADLGYYDLRLPLIREQQVELAKEAGVTAFCYWHYWFGNGKRLLADVFQEVLDSGKPDFPFCLAWANHSWRRVGCTAESISQEMLIEQTYPGIEDAKIHFDYLLKAFRDDRYVKIDGKPYLFIFDPINLPTEYIKCFQEMSIQAGFPGIFLVANVSDNSITTADMLKKGFDAITYGNISGHSKLKESLFFKIRKKIESVLLRRPTYCYDYSKKYHDFITEIDYAENVIPQIVPQWDHSPRTGKKGIIYYNASPRFFYEHVKEALNAIKEKSSSRQILMLKSWNEWAEGNYMEPDLKFGKGFIEALRKALREYEK